MIPPFSKNISYARLAWAFLCLVFGFNLSLHAQREGPSRSSTSLDDTVFAISFSPDGRTLAIARGASEPSQRFGRIELWDTETGELRRLIRGFDGPVRSISFSPDGQTLLSASSEYRSTKIQEKARSREGVVFAELKWWDAQTGELKRKLTMPGEGAVFISVTYSPDGKELAMVQSFMEIDFLSSSSPSVDLPTNTSGPPGPHRSLSPSVYFSADLKLLDAQTGESKRKLNMGQPGHVMFSPDGKLIAAWNSHEIKMWDAPTGEEKRKLKGLKATPTAIAFSPDSRTLAVASTRYYHEFSRRVVKVIGSSEMHLFDVGTGKMTLRLANLGAVNSVAFEPDGRVLLAGGVLRERDSAIPAVKLWDLVTGRYASFPTGGEDFTEAVDSLVLSGDGSLLAFRSGPATVQMLDTRTWKLKRTFDANSIGSVIERPVNRFLLSVKRVLAVAFSADGNTVSGETDQGKIKMWDPRTGELKKQLDNEEYSPSLIATSRDGKSFAEVSDGKLRSWQLTSDAKRTVPLPSGSSISAIALSTDGQVLVFSSGNDTMLLTPAGEVLKTLTRHQSGVDQLALSDDGRTLAIANQDGQIEIWNLADARIEKTITAGARITALHFSPDGLILASASEDRTVTLWNLQKGFQQQKLQKHLAAVNALAFSPDGRLLASGGDDRTVIIWETASGKAKRRLKGHDQTVTSLAFSPDGRLLASGTGNAAVVLWEVGTGKLNRVLR